MSEPRRIINVFQPSLQREELDAVAGVFESNWIGKGAEGIPLIEDSACSVASSYGNKACGTFGDIGLWSFGPVKVVSTGDGGMIYCRDAGMAERAERLLYLGLATPTGFSSEARERWWELDVSFPGRRAIMNDVASAIGIEQLKKLPAFIDRRRQIHAFYDSALEGLDWLRTPPEPPPCAQSSYYMYWIQTRPDVRDRLATWLKEDGIYTTFRYYPLHRLELFGASAPLPHAEQAAQVTLCIPIHQSLSDGDAHRIVDSIREFGKRL